MMIWLVASHVSLPIGTNGKPLAAVGKFPDAIAKLMIGKANGEEITIGSDWQMIGKHLAMIIT